MLIRSHLILMLLCCALFLRAQNPAHFILAEEELSGVDVYGLHQDKALNYWIASDNGIYKYDGYEFKKIQCKEMVSNSVFGITSDSKNNIYCYNLSGQLFKITDDVCKVHFQIPDSLISPMIELAIQADDRIFIAAKRVFELLPNKMINQEMMINHYETNLYIGKDGKIYAYAIKKNTRNSLYTIKDHKWHEQPLYKKENDSLLVAMDVEVRLFEKGDELYVIDLGTHSISKITDSIITPVSKLADSYKVRGISVSESHYWAGKNTTGVMRFTDIETPTETGETTFSNYIISSFLEDKEGNVLLGTFDHGILVIPKTQVTDINITGAATELTQICIGPNNDIYFGDYEGNIGYIDSLDQFHDFKMQQKTPIEFIKYLPDEKVFITNGSFYNENFEHSYALGKVVKDISKNAENNYTVATNLGIFTFPSNIFKKLLPKRNFYDAYLFNPHIIYRGRTYSVAYDSIHNTTYCGTSKGIKLINDKGTKEIKINGRDVLCYNFLFLDGKMYVTTRKDGLLIFENNVLIDNWTVDDHLPSNEMSFILKHEDGIIVCTDKGIQKLNKSGKTIWFLNSSNGLYADHIIDIALVNNFLWVLHQKGLQKVNLTDLQPEYFNPNISLDKISVENERISDIKSFGNFEHTQNRIEFTFSSKTLKYKSEIRYAYQLSGVDELWQEIPYSKNSVIYRTLAPGNYTFRVKAIWRNERSETLHYSFSIIAPFWTKTWFYVVITIFISLLISLYFYRKIRKQKLESQMQKELHQSKLTAIQAQMNPHFIFNSLNSIQDLVLKNDAENAYSYISKFALMVRNILNHSDKDFIEFDEEIATLELYLTLEKLRFKNAFTYHIIVENNTEDILIPPMLVQPFIENALVHGLLHKDGQKILTVKFEFKEQLICTISDNGIGREEAKRIQQRQFSKHESFALSGIKRRLKILELRFGTLFEVKYTDLLDGNEPAGTQVKITLPFQKKF